MQPTVEEKLKQEPEEDDDFSFDCGELSTSAVTAEDVFINGQIKPVFPLFNRPFSGPLKNIFVETTDVNNNDNGSGDDEIMGPYCEWSSRKAVEASPDQACKKSNSTGFSRIWRIKDQIVGRSNSDGRDTFVYLNNAAAEAEDEPKTKKEVKKRVKTTSVSAHEVYLRNKTKGDGRRRSYLPYRPELVGFFTNVNSGLTKNVHPF